MVVEMKVYLDLVFFINFMFDLLLLMTVSIECKVFSKRRYLLLGALFGTLSTFLLFLPLNNFSLFLFKIIISIIMLFLTFKIRSFKLFKTLIKSLYGNSIILGGLIYFLNNQISLKQIGFIFVKDGTSINLIIILISSPLIFYLYHKSFEEEKKKRSLLHKVYIKCKEDTFELLGYLDTGNNLCDPYKKRGIVIISNNYNIPIEKAILVPFKTIEGKGLLRCIEIKEIKIDDNLLVGKYLLGISPKKIDIKGANCILPNRIEEELK